MTVNPSFAEIRQQLLKFDVASDDYATQFVQALLASSRNLGASDLHLTPVIDGIDVRLRTDGVLQSLGTFPAGKSTHIVTRLKVLAELLTYRTDVPQEGRIRGPAAEVEISRQHLSHPARRESRRAALCGRGPLPVLGRLGVACARSRAARGADCTRRRARS